MGRLTCDVVLACDIVTGGLVEFPPEGTRRAFFLDPILNTSRYDDREKK